MRIDLHTHSNHSDGTDTPGELVRAARAAGLDVVALTDHDTVAGWDEAAAVVEGIGLVRGAEFSTKNLGHSQHLLGYEFDPDHAGMADLLERAAGSRQERVDGIHAALDRAGVGVSRDAVERLVTGGGLPGKKHFALALLQEHGVDNETAFSAYLGDGGPAAVKRWKATTEEAIRTIVAAGGVAVLAHPRGRGLTVNDLARIGALKEVGLRGIEVDHREHADQDRRLLRAIAHELDLVVTGSSDYHGLNKQDHDLGCFTTAPEELERLLGDRAPAIGGQGEAPV